jgi:signal transduction histidine kinase
MWHSRQALRETLRSVLGVPRWLESDAPPLSAAGPGPYPEPAEDHAPPHPSVLRGAALPERDLRHLLAWFVRVRWVFVTGLLLAIATGSALLGPGFPVARPLAVAALIAGYNLLFAVYHRLRSRWGVALSPPGTVEARLQIGLDLVALTVLIHFVGGARSPLVCLYLIHAIAGVMLLPRLEAWLIGAGAFGLFLAILALEPGSGASPSHLAGLTGGASSAVGFGLVLSLMLLVTLVASMAITSAIMDGLRLRERQLQAAYASLTEKQAQLLQTEKHASLGRLVAGIAHEINNPIQFVHGNMSFLAEAFSDALPILDAQHARQPDLRLARLEYAFFRKQVPVLLQDMADGAERIGQIVRELRSFARSDQGRLDEEVDLAAVVQTAERLLHNQLKHVRVEEEIDPALPRLRGNVALLQQVMVNTLQNALQAIPRDRSGRIALRARLVHEGASVELSVEDNGCGIPPEIRDRIFDPFFTTRQSAGGTGLGLAIIEGIVEQHRGRIQVESQVGKGTTFHFFLPVKGHDAA